MVLSKKKGDCYGTKKYQAVKYIRIHQRKLSNQYI